MDGPAHDGESHRFDTTNYTGGSYTARSASINTKHASSYATGAHDQSGATHSIRAPSFLRAATHHDHRNPNPGLPGWLFRNAGAKSNKNVHAQHRWGYLHGLE